MRDMRTSFLNIAAKCGAAAGDADGTVEGLVIRGGDDLANLGSAVHKAAEALVPTGAWPESLEEIAAKYHVEAGDVGKHLSYIKLFWDQYGPAYPKPETELELSTILEAGEGKEDIRLTGHVDLLSLFASAEGRIIDWKTGFRTDSDAEPQVRGYALLVCRTYGVAEVQATVVWTTDKTMQVWRWTREELEAWAGDLTKTLNTPGEFSVGEHCRYCPRFWTCPAHATLARRAAEELAGLDGAGLLLPDVAVAIYPAVQRAARLIELYKEQVKHIIRTTGPLPVDGEHVLALVATKRQVIDPPKAWPVLWTIMDPNKILDAVKISKTALLDAVAADAPRGQKGKAKAGLMQTLEAAGAVSEGTDVESLRVVRRDSVQP